jgi:hypothetical protein
MSALAVLGLVFIAAVVCLGVWVVLGEINDARRLHDIGCCTSCIGTGYSGDEAVPGGKCWDCYGTGHPHAGRCRRWS